MQQELTIYKYEIPFKDFSSILLPVGAKILKFAIVHRPHIWCIVDKNQEKAEMINFSIVGTGVKFLPQYSYDYIGTAVQDAGSCISHGIVSSHFVLHLFKLTDKCKM